MSPKPQTTRHRILGILNRPDAQIVFVDTPGLHLGERRAMNRHMNRAARASLLDADVNLLVIEALRWTEEDASALAELTQGTFDCMVLDLGLPDMTGFELLERMSSDPASSFPPVIVYTARTLSPDEELRLRRYSRSVVIKGARSPERLLDEVTLFIHRVESTLPREQQRLLREARNRDAVLEGRRVLLVEDDVRNVFALTSALESKGATIDVARNGREALDALARAADGAPRPHCATMKPPPFPARRPSAGARPGR